MAHRVDQDRLRIVPCSHGRANEFIQRLHRHHKPSTRGIFALAVVDETGQVRGVAIAGRPVARLLDDGLTMEVNRVCTDGVANGCSALYGAVARAAKALGYRKIITYILEAEPGTSLRAAGWLFEEPIRARSWNMPGRPRIDKTAIVRRGRWGLTLNPDVTPVWPVEEIAQQNMILEAI